MHTEGDPIMLYGKPETQIRRAALGPLTFSEASFPIPTPISIIHPYYIEKRQGQIMQFHTEMQPGVFYLARGRRCR